MIQQVVDKINSPFRTIKAPNNFFSYPKHWEPYYNGTNEPCDMLQGPCSCGAWHSLSEWEIDTDVRNCSVSK